MSGTTIRRPDEPATERQQTFIKRLARELGDSLDTCDAWARDWFGTNVDGLTRRDASQMIERLYQRLVAKQAREQN